MLEILTQHKRLFLFTIFGALTLTGLSLLAYFFPALHSFLFFGVLILTLAGSYWNPRFPLVVLVLDLVISSMGRLLEVSVFGTPVSLRMGLFAIAIVVGSIEWAVHRKRRLQDGTNRLVYGFSDLVILSCVFAMMILFGVLNGWVHDYPITNILQDVNNYLFFALLLVLPTLLYQKKHLEQLLAAVLGGLTALWMETFTLFVLFSHRVMDLAPIYRFTRDTRIAEVTIQQAGWVRVFFQSHVFALLLVWVAILVIPLLWKKRHPDRWLWIWVAVSSVSMIMISFSRSFWAAAGVGVVLLVLMGVLRRRIFEGVVKPLLIGAGCVAVSLGFVWLLIQLPFPSSRELSIESVQDRATELGGEVALGSRFQLFGPLKDKIFEAPFLGSGFGTTVTYQTQDPRFIAVNNSELYTTFVFEWGYLDTLTEIGALGLGVYLLLLLAVAWRILAAPSDDISSRALLDGLVLSLIVLVATHAVTPYLNHPLGIFWVLWLVVVGLFWNPVRFVMKRRT